MEAQRRQIIRAACFNRKGIKKNIGTNESISNEIIFTVGKLGFKDEESILGFIKSIDSYENVEFTNYVASKLVDYMSEKYIKPYNPYGYKFFSNVFDKNAEIARAMNSVADYKWFKKMDEFYHINVYSVFFDPKTSKNENEIFVFIKSVMDSNDSEMVNYIAERLIDYTSEKYIKTKDSHGWEFIVRLYNTNSKLVEKMSEMADDKWLSGIDELYKLSKMNEKRLSGLNKKLSEINEEIDLTKHHLKFLSEQKSVIEEAIKNI